MGEPPRSDVRTGLRALASPPAVLCLVVLLLNDHVLKQAWPGPVTGKLSDVVGLVVAPLVLGALLATTGLRRPLAWALGLVGAGFVVTKSTAAGAAAVSAAWSATGIDTHIVADPTDLLALPALWGAHRLWQRAAVHTGPRRLPALVGLALLPVGVLATAATSACDEDEGVRFPQAVEGRFSGDGGDRSVAVLVSDHRETRALHPGGEVRTLPETDRLRVRTGEAPLPAGQCTSDGLRCWRAVAGVVTASTDGGRSWTVDLEVPAAERAAAIEGVGESCGQPPSADLDGLAVAEDERGVLVVVAAQHAGVWVRDAASGWRRITRGELAAAPVAGSEETARGPLRAVTAVAPRHEPAEDPEPSPVTPPRPPCPPRERVTVTPDPANGGPVQTCR